MDSQTLIVRCKAGEREALHLLYEQYRPRLLNICRQYVKDNNVAEDLLHDAFVIILTSLNQLRDDDKLGSWMATIVRTVRYHSKIHLDKEQAALQQMGIDKQGATDPGITPDFEQLQKLVAQLPAGYRQVFRLSVFEGLSHQEIGHLLGIAPHTSSSQLSHAKRMLKILIKQSWVLILLLIAPALARTARMAVIYMCPRADGQRRARHGGAQQDNALPHPIRGAQADAEMRPHAAHTA